MSARLRPSTSVQKSQESTPARADAIAGQDVSGVSTHLGLRCIAPRLHQCCANFLQQMAGMQLCLFVIADTVMRCPCQRSVPCKRLTSTCIVPELSWSCRSKARRAAAITSSESVALQDDISRDISLPMTGRSSSRQEHRVLEHGSGFAARTYTEGLRHTLTNPATGAREVVFLVCRHIPLSWTRHGNCWGGAG